MVRWAFFLSALLTLITIQPAIVSPHGDDNHDEDHHENDAEHHDDDEDLLNANILRFMKGAKIRDHKGNWSTSILDMKYELLNGTLGEISGEVGEYIFNLPYTKIRVINATGKMRGIVKVKAKLSAKRGPLKNKNINIDVEGAYVLETKGSNVNITVLVPDITANNLQIQGCNATFVESSIMLEIPMKKGEVNLAGPLSQWVDRALKREIQTIFCNAVEDEVKKGNESKVARAAILQIIAALLSG